MSQDNIPSNEKLIADLKEVVRELWRAVDTHRHYDVYIQKLLDTPYAPVHQTSEQPIVQPPKHFDPKDSGWICPVCEGWNPLGRLQCQHPHAHETCEQEQVSRLLLTIRRQADEIRALRIGHGFRNPDALDQPSEKAAVIHNPDCVKENARIDGRDRWYMLDCDCGTDKNG